MGQKDGLPLGVPEALLEAKNVYLWFLRSLATFVMLAVSSSAEKVVHMHTDVDWSTRKPEVLSGASDRYSSTATMHAIDTHAY